MRCNSKINCSKQFFRHVIILAPIERHVQLIPNSKFLGIDPASRMWGQFGESNQTSRRVRKLDKAVAVSGVCSGVLEENSGKVLGKLLE